MASALQLLALVGIVVGIALIWGWEWSVLVGSVAALAVGIALEPPRGST